MFTNNYRLSKPPIKGRRRRAPEREEVAKAVLIGEACMYKTPPYSKDAIQ